MASTSCARFQVTIIPCRAAYFANSIFTAGEYFVYSPLTVLHGFLLFESIALVPSLLVATIADDVSHKDNGPVGWGCLSFNAKYLYNDILTHV